MKVVSATDFTPTSKDIIALISGGVDSAVTSLLLKRAGFNVLGVTMMLPGESDAPAKAAKVAEKVGIAHAVIDVRAEFENLIIDGTRQAYMRGETPSPCVSCNRLFQFGAVWDFVRGETGVENIATGHYARIESGRLLRGADRGRDQSYFLYGIPRERLDKVFFPCGGRTKDEIRQIAREIDLEVSERADSMELCFTSDYRDLIPPEEPGDILSVDGTVMGVHKGISFYTVGQRRGIGIAAPEPYYVLAVNPTDNTVTIGSREEAYRNEVSVKRVNFLGDVEVGKVYGGKIRSGGEPKPCRIVELDGDDMTVRFDAPVFAPAAGQHCVLYEDDAVMCGGEIVLK